MQVIAIETETGPPGEEPSTQAPDFADPQAPDPHACGAGPVPFARVKEIDTSHSQRLAITMEMLSEVSRAVDPEDAVKAFSSRFWRIRRIDLLLAVSIRNMPKGQYKITRRTRVVLKDGEYSQEYLQENPWKHWQSLPAHSGGFLGQVIAEGRPRLFHHLDLRSDPIIGEEVGGMGSVMALPTFDRGEPLNWTFQFRAEPDFFTVEDLGIALLIGNLFGSITRSLVMLEENRRLTDRLRQQFEEVARVQQSLLPRQLPKVPGVQIATSYLTSEQAGGDYYDFFELPGGKLGIVIADVSGHGPGAATVMAMLHAMIHAYPGDPESAGPSGVLKFANQRLYEASLDGSFVTAFVGLFDPRTLELTYSNAGHPPPRVKDRTTGKVEALEGESTFPMGIIEDYEAPQNCVKLRKGQTLVLYTDGISESRPPPGHPRAGRMFGEAGIDAALVECSGAAECVVDSIHRAIFEHTGLRTRADDQTLVVLEILGP